MNRVAVVVASLMITSSAGALAPDFKDGVSKNISDKVCHYKKNGAGGCGLVYTNDVPAGTLDIGLTIYYMPPRDDATETFETITICDGRSGGTVNLNDKKFKIDNVNHPKSEYGQVAYEVWSYVCDKGSRISR